MDIKWTTKDAEMTLLWLHTSEFLLCVLQDFVRTLVLDLDFYVECFFPKKHWQVLVLNHGLSNTYDGSILLLCNPILLWIVRNNQLPLDSFLLAKTLEVLGGILTPIFLSQEFDILPCLVLN
jgi:hypothetical protein